MAYIYLQPLDGNPLKGSYPVKVTDKQFESVKKKTASELRIFLKRFFRKYPQHKEWNIRYRLHFYSKTNHILTPGWGFTKRVKLRK